MYQIDLWVNWVLNSTFANMTRIESENTIKGDNYTAILSVFNGTAWGVNQTGNVIVQNALPEQASLLINATTWENKTGENLTVFNQSTTDLDGDQIKNVYVWNDGVSKLPLLYLPFEGGSNGTFCKDYSTFGNDANVSGAVWNATNGYDGFGAYEFDGSSSMEIEVNSLNNAVDFSISLWFKTDRTDYLYHLFWIGEDGGNGLGNQDEMHLSFGRWQYGGPSAGAMGDTLTFWWSDTQNAAGGFEMYTDFTDTTDWNHLAITLANTTSTPSQGAMYLNGVVVDIDLANKDNIVRTLWDKNLTLGTDSVGGREFEGSMSEFVIYNWTLSPEQVYALYSNRTNEIVSEETNIGDNWTVEVISFDDESNGTVEEVSVVILANTVPTIDNFFMDSTDVNNYTNGTINVSFDLSDDAEMYQVDWWVNEVFNTTFANLTRIESVNLTPDDNYTVVVAAFDGADWGLNKTGSVIVQDIPLSPVEVVSSESSSASSGSSFAWSSSGRDLTDEEDNSSLDIEDLQRVPEAEESFVVVPEMVLPWGLGGFFEDGLLPVEILLVGNDGSGEVELKYVLKDDEGRVIWKGNDFVFLDGNFSMKKDLDLPDYLEEGEYVLSMETLTGSAVSFSNVSFVIEGESLLVDEESEMFVLFLFFTLILGFAGIYLFLGRN